MVETNPYATPKTAEDAAKHRTVAWLWLGAAISVLASILSLWMFGLYGHWHWHKGTWSSTLPGELGFSWLAAVGGAKECSTALALVSLLSLIVVFCMGGRRQAAVALPICLLSLLTIPLVT